MKVSCGAARESGDEALTIERRGQCCREIDALSREQQLLRDADTVESSARQYRAHASPRAPGSRLGQRPPCMRASALFTEAGDFAALKLLVKSPKTAQDSSGGEGGNLSKGNSVERNPLRTERRQHSPRVRQAATKERQAAVSALLDHIDDVGRPVEDQENFS